MLGTVNIGFPWWLQWERIHLQYRRPGFDPWVGKISWRWARQPTLVFLPGESHGQRSLAGYSLWGHKELDTTEWLSTAHNEYYPGNFHFSSWPPHEVSALLLLSYRAFCEKENSKINCNRLETLGECSLTLFYIYSEPEHNTLKKKQNTSHMRSEHLLKWMDIYAQRGSLPQF